MPRKSPIKTRDISYKEPLRIPSSSEEDDSGSEYGTDDDDQGSSSDYDYEDVQIIPTANTEADDKDIEMLGVVISPEMGNKKGRKGRHPPPSPPPVLQGPWANWKGNRSRNYVYLPEEREELAAKRRMEQRIAQRQRRARMTEEEREAALKRGRLRTQKGRERKRNELMGALERGEITEEEFRKRKIQIQGTKGRRLVELATGLSGGNQEGSSSTPSSEALKLLEDQVRYRLKDRYRKRVYSSTSTWADTMVKRISRKRRENRDKGLKGPSPRNYQEEDDVAFTQYFREQTKLEFSSRMKRLKNEYWRLEIGDDKVPSPDPPKWLVEGGGSGDFDLDDEDDVEGNPKSLRDRVVYTFNYDDDDQDSDEEYGDIIKSFNDVGSMGGSGDTDTQDDVQDWIARMISNEEMAEGNLKNSLKKSSKLVALQRVKDMIEDAKKHGVALAPPPSTSPKAVLHYYKEICLKQTKLCQIQRVKGVYETSRATWIKEKPEDEGIREQVDSQRKLMRERFLQEKKAGIKKFSEFLIQRRTILSKETLEERRSRVLKELDEEKVHVHRIVKNYAEIRKIIPPGPKKPVDLQARKAQNASKASIRCKMEKNEYELFSLILEALGLPLPIVEKDEKGRKSGKFPSPFPGSCENTRAPSIKDFEGLLTSGKSQETINFWGTYQCSRTKVDVIYYRKMLLDIASSRRKNRETTASGDKEQVAEYVPAPEEQSLKDIRKLKEFIIVHGPNVLEHLAYKRFYMGNKFVEGDYNRKYPEKMEKQKLKNNAYARRMWHLKKRGIDIGNGYWDRSTETVVAEKTSKTRAAMAGSSSSSGPSKRTRKVQPKAKGGRQAVPAANKIRRSSRGKTKPRPPPLESSNSYADSNTGDDHGFIEESVVNDYDDGWIPMGSCTVNNNSGGNVIENPANQNHPPTMFHQPPQSNNVAYHQNHQGFPSVQQHVQYHHQPIQNPQLQLVNPLFGGNQMQVTSFNTSTPQQLQHQQSQQVQVNWNPVTPLNYTLQFLPDSQVNLVSQQPITTCTTTTSQNWGQQGSSSYQQESISSYSNSLGDDNDPESEWEEIPPPSMSPPKRKGARTRSQGQGRGRGRPKGSTSTNKPPHQTPKNPAKFHMKSKSVPVPRGRRNHSNGKDIWNNRKRRKYYVNGQYPPGGQGQSNLRESLPPNNELLCPFQRDPELLRKESSSIFQNIEENLLPKCPHCGKVLNNDSSLQRHIQAYHPQKQNVEETTKNEQNHTPTEPPEPEPVEDPKICKICTNKLENRNKSGMLDHIFNVHFEIGQYGCPFGKERLNNAPRKKKYTRSCSNFKFDRRGLIGHIQKKHKNHQSSSWIFGISKVQHIKGAERFCCLNCGEGFGSYFAVSEHYKETHDRRGRYWCSECGIYLRMPDMLADHKQLFHPKENGGKPSCHQADFVELLEDTQVSRCTSCYSEFSSALFLDEHYAKGHRLPCDIRNRNVKEDPQYLCDACDEPFHSLVEKQCHVNTCKEKGSELECHWCKLKKGESEEELAKHISTVHPKEPPVVVEDETSSEILRIYLHQRYKCELCQSSFLTLGSLRLHMFRNHELKEYLEELKGKNVSFYPLPEVETINVHQDDVEEPTPGTSSSVHKIPRIPKAKEARQIELKQFDMVCPKCPEQVQIHEIHKIYDKLMRRYCPTCDRLFSRLAVIKQHNEAVHGILPENHVDPPPCGTKTKDAQPEDNLFPCRCCSYSFSAEEIHQMHLFSEKDPDLRKCEDCDLVCRDPNKFRHHLHTVHNKPVLEKMRTSVPKNPTQTRKDLNPEDFDKLITSITNKTGNEEVTIFTCRVCLKNFKTWEFVKLHIADVHKEDAFTRVLCKDCNATFASHNTLSKHVRHHHNPDATRYLCYACDGHYKRKDHLRDHFRKEHPESEPIEMRLVKTIELTEIEGSEAFHYCKICGNHYITEEGLKSHMTTKHFPSHFSTFCDHCGLQVSPTGLKNHEKQCHSDKSTGAVTVQPQPQNPPELFMKKPRVSLMEVMSAVQAYDELRRKRRDVGISMRKATTRRKLRKIIKKEVNSDGETIETPPKRKRGRPPKPKPVKPPTSIKNKKKRYIKEEEEDEEDCESSEEEEEEDGDASSESGSESSSSDEEIIPPSSQKRRRILKSEDEGEGQYIPRPTRSRGRSIISKKKKTPTKPSTPPNNQPLLVLHRCDNLVKKIQGRSRSNNNVDSDGSPQMEIQTEDFIVKTEPEDDEDFNNFNSSHTPFEESVEEQGPSQGNNNWEYLEIVPKPRKSRKASRTPRRSRRPLYDPLL